MKLPAAQLFITFTMLVAFLIINSCKKEDDYEANNDKSIQEYLEKKGLTAQKTESGLYYLITVPGNTQKPDINSKVTVHYKGYLLDDSVFDSSYPGSAITFPMSGVITGWREGLQLYGKGGKGTLFIPAKLAYGSTAMPGIPANSVLIFDIHLINIE